jgi:hypothetical protein
VNTEVEGSRALEAVTRRLVKIFKFIKSFRPQYALGFTQPLTGMSTKNIKIIMFLGSKVRLVRRADNLIVIYEPIV